MTAQANGYRDLRVWQSSMALTRMVYAITRRFPPGEQYGLVPQMRRAAVSVASNVAEGHSRPRRSDNREFRRFVAIALGSAAELATQLEIAKGEGFLAADEIDVTLAKTAEVARMLRRLYASLEAPTPNAQRPTPRPRSASPSR